MSAVEEHQKEIKRRTALVRSGHVNSRTFERVEGIGSDPPFQNEEQQWVLFSVSHVGMPPRSRRADRPALRVYGCFPTREEAMEYAARLTQYDKTCNLQLNRTHEWILACRDPTRLADEEYVRRKTQRLLKAHMERLVSSDKNFEETKLKMQQDTSKPMVEDGVIPSDSEEEEWEEQAEGCDEDPGIPEGAIAAPQTLPGSCEVAGQRQLCICFIDDKEDEQEPEFLFQVLQCFATDAEADRYVRNVASPRIQDVDIDLVTTLRWLFPTAPMDESVRKEYRSSELTAIMDYRRNEPRKVEELRRQEKEGALLPSLGGGAEGVAESLSANHQLDAEQS